MSQLGVHVNIVRLEEALELVEDSKCTIFLVLELAAGGELFDRYCKFSTSPGSRSDLMTGLSSTKVPTKKQLGYTFVNYYRVSHLVTRQESVIET